MLILFVFGLVRLKFDLVSVCLNLLVVASIGLVGHKRVLVQTLVFVCKYYWSLPDYLDHESHIYGIS